MAKVDVHTWKEFRLGDLFDIIRGTSRTMRMLNAGAVPVIAAARAEQGVAGHYDVLPEYADAITISCNGVGCGSVFYHDGQFAITGDASVMQEKQEMTREAKLFVAAICDSLFFAKYSYAEKCNPAGLAEEMIFLPATPDGQPDWAYMDAYMSEVFKKEEVFAQHLASLTDETAGEGHVVDTSSWKAFRLGDLFDVVPTKGKNTYGLEDGCDLAYIAASRENNGVNRMIAKDNMADFISAGNCLVFIHIGDAAAGFCHYVRDDFVGMAGKTSCGYLKNHVMTETLGLFLAGVIRNVNEGLYSFGESWTGNRLMDTMLPLPATPDGQPDWAYMEEYMRQIMAREQVFADHLASFA